MRRSHGQKLIAINQWASDWVRGNIVLYRTASVGRTGLATYSVSGSAPAFSWRRSKRTFWKRSLRFYLCLWNNISLKASGGGVPYVISTTLYPLLSFSTVTPVHWINLSRKTSVSSPLIRKSSYGVSWGLLKAGLGILLLPRLGWNKNKIYTRETKRDLVLYCLSLQVHFIGIV